MLHFQCEQLVIRRRIARYQLTRETNTVRLVEMTFAGGTIGTVRLTADCTIFLE